MNVAAEAVTVADLAALAEGTRAGGQPELHASSRRSSTAHRVAEYLRDCVAA